MVYIQGEFSILSKMKIWVETQFPNFYEYCYLHPMYHMVDPGNDRNIRQFITDNNLPKLLQVQIETINRCNGECAFCPGNRHDDTRELKIMSDELFKSVIGQLHDMDYSGRLVMQCNNEPLLDKKIVERVAYARKQVPKAYMLMYTNGILLNLWNLENLIKNLDMFYLDNYYINPNQPMNIATALALAFIEKHPEYSDRLTIIYTRQNAKRGSRAGLATNRKFVQLKSICDYPFTDMNIMPDGQLTMCCNDTMAFTAVGDLTKETIEKAFMNDKYQGIREKMLKSGRQSIPRCHNCDVCNKPPQWFPSLMAKLGGNK